MAMVFATLTGLGFSVQAITMKFSLDVGADINQSFYDCSFFTGMSCLPFFIAEFCKDTIIYSKMDIVIANGAVTAGCIGVAFLGKGFQYGNAGSV